MAHNLTVTIEDPLWTEMKKHSEIRWSAVMKEAAKEKIRALHVLGRLTEKTKLSDENIEKLAVALGKKVSRRK